MIKTFKKIIVFIILIKINFSFGQEIVPLTGLEHKPDLNLDLEFYGYINVDYWYDTNQVIASRQDHNLLAPEPVVLDKLGRNINDRGEFAITAIASRFGISVSKNNWLNCSLNTKARIEVDFRGVEEETIGTIRLRHAYFEIIKPDDYTLLFGQYYDPLYIPECSSYMLGYDNGAPMDPQARNPQIRLTKNFGTLEFTLAALAQQPYPSPGPIGFNSRYQRNSLTPMFTLRLINNWNENFAGAAIAYKRLIPRLITDTGYKTNSSINSIIAQVFLRLIYYNSWFIRTKLIYAQNGPDQELLGGYGVTTIDPITDIRKYENINSIAAWLDSSKLITSKFEIGIFAGIVQKLSNNNFYINPLTNKPIVYDLTEELKRAKSIIKIAPRVFWAKDPIRFGFEINYSRAEYGKFNSCGNLVNLIPSDNLRFLAAFYYLF